MWLSNLTRLWQHQGKRVEAYELLAPIYDWFTEGFETADLQEAKALLEELAKRDAGGHALPPLPGSLAVLQLGGCPRINTSGSFRHGL